MHVRHPEFDLSDSVPHWGDDVAGCTIINGGAVIPPPIERYLIKVMRRAKQHLDGGSDAALLADMAVFNQQEGQHLKVHGDLLEMIRLGGYPEVREHEAAFERDLEGFLATRDLEWNLAYAESFESAGTAMAEAWLDGHMARLCGDHGSVPMRLWTWHMAEEFEHRTVVHDVMERVVGPERAGVLRREVVPFGRDHFSQHAARAAGSMFAIDREGLVGNDLDAALEAEQNAWLAQGEVVGDAMGWVFEEDYDPRAVPPPAGYAAVLAEHTPTG